MLACSDELISRVVLVYLVRHLFTGAGVAHLELMVYPDCFPCQQTNRYGVSGGIADAFDDCCIHAPPLLIRAESKPVNVAGGRQFYLPPRNDTENPVIIIVVCDHLRSASVSPLDKPRHRTNFDVPPLERLLWHHLRNIHLDFSGADKAGDSGVTAVVPHDRAAHIRSLEKCGRRCYGGS